MKALLPIVAALTAFAAAAPARAADLPLKAPAAAAVAYSWTGFYIGGQAGYGFGHNSSSFSGFDPGDTPPSVHPDGGGVVLGG